MCRKAPHNKEKERLTGSWVSADCRSRLGGVPNGDMTTERTFHRLFSAVSHCRSYSHCCFTSGISVTISAWCFSPTPSNRVRPSTPSHNIGSLPGRATHGLGFKSQDHNRSITLYVATYHERQTKIKKSLHYKSSSSSHDVFGRCLPAF